MNYTRIYESFIADRRGREADLIASGEYFERHHITPRSLGGGDEPENLIALTAGDHFFAHLCLAKIHGGKMWVALNAMGMLVLRNGPSPALFRARKWFAVAREQLAKNNPMHNLETRAKAGESIKARFAEPEMRKKLEEAWSAPARRAAIRDSKLGERNPSKRDDVREKLRIAQTGRTYPNEVNAKKGRKGRHVSEETREKLRANILRPEHRAKLLAIHTGRKKTREEIEKRREAMKGHVRTPEHCDAISRAKSKTITCVETGETYLNAAEAAKAVGTSRTSILRACKNGHEWLGFHWQKASS